MIEILRDNMWQSVGGILRLLAVLAPIWLYIKQKSKKILAYDIKETTPLISIHQSIQGNLKIYLGEHQVEKVHVGTVVFLNKGNTAITRQDFDESLSIGFTRNGQILSCDIVDKLPRKLNLDFQVAEKSVNFKPFLLNKGEKFTVKTVVIDGSVDINPSARIIAGNLKPCTDTAHTPIKRILRKCPPEYIAIVLLYFLWILLFFFMIV